MKIGYDYDAYRHLCEAHRRLPSDKRVGRPFVSVAGPHYANAPCRILYIGKALAGEAEDAPTGSLPEFQESASWSSYWLGRQSLPSTSFWEFAAVVVGAVMPSHAEPATSYIAWSNVAKVTQHGKGAPDASVCATMHEADCAALRMELANFAPQLVVMVSASAVWNVATCIFGDREQMDEAFADRAWLRRRGPFKFYWTHHPQGKSLQWRADQIARITQLARGQ